LSRQPGPVLKHRSVALGVDRLTAFIAAPISSVEGRNKALLGIPGRDRGRIAGAARRIGSTSLKPNAKGGKPTITTMIGERRRDVKEPLQGAGCFDVGPSCGFDALCSAVCTSRVAKGSVRQISGTVSVNSAVEALPAQLAGSCMGPPLLRVPQSSARCNRNKLAGPHGTAKRMDARQFPRDSVRDTQKRAIFQPATNLPGNVKKSYFALANGTLVAGTVALATACICLTLRLSRVGYRGSPVSTCSSGSCRSPCR